MAKADAEKEKAQLERFKDAARKAETDDSEEAFDRALRKVAKPEPRPPGERGTKR